MKRKIITILFIVAIVGVLMVGLTACAPADPETFDLNAIVDFFRAEGYTATFRENFTENASLVEVRDANGASVFWIWSYTSVAAANNGLASLTHYITAQNLQYERIDSYTVYGTAAGLALFNNNFR